MVIVADENITQLHEAFGPLGRVIARPGRAIRREDVRDADALIVRSVTPVHAGLLDGTRVRFVGSATAGIDHVDVEYLASRGIAFAYAPGSNAPAVAEYVAAAILELACVRGFDPAGQTLGVIGVGQVGTRVVRLAQALGMHVIENDPPRAEAEGDERFRPLAEVQRHADIITLHVPLTASGRHATRHMVDAAWLAALRPAAILINTSRGEVVDEQAVCDARDAGRLGGLVIDVWRNEPTVNPELCRRCDIATPHMAGYSLDARLAGTRMIHEALCGWAGLRSTWTPDLGHSMLPVSYPASADAGAARGRAGIAEALRVIRQVLDLPALTVGRCADFDAVRARCAVRREFAAHRVEGVVAVGAAALLGAVGFRTTSAAASQSS